MGEFCAKSFSRPRLCFCFGLGWISAASYKTQQPLCLFTCCVRCEGSMTAQADVALASVEPIPDQIECRPALPANTKTNKGGVPQHRVGWQLIDSLLGDLS